MTRQEIQEIMVQAIAGTMDLTEAIDKIDKAFREKEETVVAEVSFEGGFKTFADAMDEEKKQG